MQKNRILIISLIVLSLLGLSLLRVSAQSNTLSDPYAGYNYGQMATTLYMTFLYTRPDINSDAVYQLPSNERVRCQYMKNDFYLCSWTFSDKYQPIFGWFPKSSIILDSEVTPASP